MLILGIDTATPWGSIALCDDDAPIFEVSLKKLKGGGEYLLSVLQEGLFHTGRKIEELRLIAVGTGPGSYTGIRVGLAAVFGLAAGLDIPVKGISTLKILAENCRLASEWIAPMLDARRGEIYGAVYRSLSGELEEIRPPQAVNAQEFAATFSDYPGIMLCGDASKVYFNRVDFQIAPVYWDRPLASLAVEIAIREWVAGTTDLDTLTATYLKRVEAEVRLEEKQDDHKNHCGTDES